LRRSRFLTDSSLIPRCCAASDTESFTVAIPGHYTGTQRDFPGQPRTGGESYSAGLYIAYYDMGRDEARSKYLRAESSVGQAEFQLKRAG
jgi:hypothetical protein